MQQLQQFKSTPKIHRPKNNKTRILSSAHSKNNIEYVISNRKRYISSRSISKASKYRSLQNNPPNGKQKQKYNLSPEANLRNSLTCLQEKFIKKEENVQSARMKQDTGNVSPSVRKNTSPQKIREISQYLKGEGIGPSKVTNKQLVKIEEENDKVLIQKLLSIRCKVIKNPKSIIQSQVELTTRHKTGQKNQPIIEPPQTMNTEGADQLKICNILMKKLQPDIYQQNHAQSQFRQLVEKQSKQNQEDKKQYNNKDIYVNIRKSYKDEPEKEEKVSRYNSNGNPQMYKTDKDMLKMREDLFHKFTFYKKRKEGEEPRDESPIKGW